MVALNGLLPERVAIVTGSSRGIGAEIAMAFARSDFHAVVTYRSQRERAEDVVDAIRQTGANASSLQVDIRSEASVTAMLDGVRQKFGRVDSLVCNAVDEVIKPIDEASLDEWHVPLLTKLDGAFLCTKYAIPLLQESDNPSITYITSVDGDRPNGDYLGYQVGTAGLMAMTKANAVYLGRKYGIRVNAVAPGPVRTELWGPDLDNEEMWQRFNSKSPLHRVGTGAEVGDACVWLAIDPHRFLNGVFVDVDGGSRLI